MNPRRIYLFLIVSGLCAVAYVCTAQEINAPREVTFNRDVAPILFKNCVVCHRPNDIAPMSLMTYKETRMWARPIRDAVVNRKMPPWHADPQVGDFINDPRLTDAEIATIDSWVRTGAREGDPKDLPPAPAFAEGWHIKPDVVFTIPEFLVSGASQDDYEYIYVPTNFS
jgi:mono/diheme cytochrome c family protein